MRNGQWLTTPAELDALPAGVIVVDPYGMPARKEGKKWRTLANTYWDAWQILRDDPVAIIYTPEITKEKSD